MKTKQYNSVSKIFHWLIVVMLLIEFAVGWLMPGIRRSITPAGLMSFHMSFGIVILGVMLLRILWRFLYPVPAPAPSSPWWQELVSTWTHYLLYASVIVLPLTGWFLASIYGWSVTVFNLFTLPSLISPNVSLERWAVYAHVLTAAGVVGLIGLHVLASLYHYYIVKDKVMQRMLPQ